MNELFPIINDINITEETSLITSSGAQIDAHLIKILSSDKEEYLFGMSHTHLQNLYFLLGKILMK